MKNLLLVLPVVLASTAYADDSESRDVGEFDAIHVRTGIHLTLTQGDRYTVTVIADNGDVEDVLTEVRHGRLDIGREEKRFWWSGASDWNERYRVEVTLPVLEDLISSGGSRVEVDSQFSGDELNIKASGGSDIDFNGKYKSLEVTTSGGADVRLEGAVDELELRSSGGSDLDATRLEAQNADVRTSGGASVRLTVHNSLYARASGGSDIHYFGDPAETDIDESRNADITAR